MNSSDEGKLFIGGIAWDTTEDKLTDYFSNYGEVAQTVVMRDKTTGRPRGFGFVIFRDPSVLDVILEEKHTIDGRMVEAKRALPREDQSTVRQDNSGMGRGDGGVGNIRTKKIFVGGLPPSLTEVGFRQYFENYGRVADAVIMFDQTTQRPRGFGFISFEDEDAVEQVLHKTFHDLSGKLVEVKRALPKDANPGGSNQGGGYQNYGSSRRVNSFDNRMGENRFLQSQTSGGSYPSYPGYGAQGYGYGAMGGGMGYGGYGSYRSGNGGLGGGYGMANATGAGYGSGPPNAMKNSWNNQAGYGGDAASLSAPPSQSTSGAVGYGFQGYSYGGYGGNGYGPSGYGAVGGGAGSHPGSNAGGEAGGQEQQRAGAGYMGSGYR